MRPSLDGSRFDAVVLGGGINGVAVAREFVRAGRSVLLLEQADFGGGTTSRSTRIIHGGLRYLEYGEFGLVRESLRERARLAAESPHLIRPLHFLLPIGPGSRRSPLEIRLGLWLYRKLGGSFGSPARSRSDKVDALLDHGRWSVFSYDDGQCEFPERLVADWLVESCEMGLEARNYSQALEVVKANGSVIGVRVRDLLSGAEFRVATTRVINAAGPWVDAICRASGLSRGRPLIGGVRGTHVVLPRWPGAPRSAFYGEAADGRPIFLVPWNGQLLLGTTEVPDGGDPARVHPSDSEIDYLFTWLRRFFPGARLGREAMLYAYAGVRPLPFAPGHLPAEVTRRHHLHDHAAEQARGMVSIIGGKLTTAGSLAREVARACGISVQEPRGVGFLPEAGEAVVEAWTAELAHRSGLPRTKVEALVRRHGPRARPIAELAAGDSRMRQPLCEGTPHLVAEAVFALRRERAVHLGDVLLRRVPLALAGWWSEDATRLAAQRIGAAMNWTAQETESEIERFETERAHMLYRDVAAAPLRRRA